MAAALSFPNELEKSAPCHGSAVDIVFVHGLRKGSTKDDEQLYDYSETAICQEKSLVYNMTIDGPGYGVGALTFTFPCTKQAALDVLSKLASERERSQRTAARIIFVAHGSGAEALSQALHLANRSSTEKTDTHGSILTSTYGMISLPNPRRRRLLHSFFLTAGQLMCYMVFYNYEARRAPRSTDPPTAAPFLRLVRNPSTPLLVCAAFAYGILATIQFHINSTDGLQRHFVFIGVLIGACTLLPSLANLDQRPALVSTLSLSLIAAMGLSTCAHWLWRTFFRTREARLNRKIVEWVQDASVMDVRSHVIRFHEIV